MGSINDSENFKLRNQNKKEKNETKTNIIGDIIFKYPKRIKH
jgi:hypothetical protein